MDIKELFLIFGLSLCMFQIRFLVASYKCGIRKHSFLPLIRRAWKAEEGEWPWHVALFHKNATGFLTYACGGTLIDEKHILTAAHCVVIRYTSNSLSAASIELHFGQLNLSKTAVHTQIRDVSEVHVHPGYSTHRNDVAVLVTRLPVDYTDFVIPICMDQQADENLQNLENKRGYITGWGTTQNKVRSEVLRTASMPVVSHAQCINHDKTLVRNKLNEDVFCAGDRNGTSPGTGDSGGGMYLSEGDRWVLKGIVSFANADEIKEKVDTTKYTVFVNVQRFLKWIKEILNETKLDAAIGPKRKSEEECDKYRGFAKKKPGGTCANNRHPHTVSISFFGRIWCNGALVNELFVLTSCHCLQLIQTMRETEKIRGAVKVETDLYGVSLVVNINCHPNASIGTHDLALLALYPRISLSSNLIPACLASNSTENLYDTLLQTGLQLDKNGVEKPIDSEKIKVVKHEECPEQGSLLCVANTDRSRDGYQPFLGSPLQSVNSRTCMYTIVGLASHGTEQLGVNNTAPHKYIRISHYLDWIEGMVWNVNLTNNNY